MKEAYREIESRLLELITHPGELSEGVFIGVALAIYRFQRLNNPAYESYCRHLGAPLELDGWRSIPAVPQSAFKHSPLRAFPEELTTKTFHTSGTTGEGFGQHHFLSTRLYEAAILGGWDYFKLPRLRQVILTPSPEHAPHSSLSHMMGCLSASRTGSGASRTGSGASRMGGGASRTGGGASPTGSNQTGAAGGDQHFCIREDGRIDFDCLKKAVAGGEPVLLMGTALAFLHLFEGGERLQLPAGSFALETGGYKGHQRVLTKVELYEMFKDHLGLAADSIINEYGMTELSSQFYTRGVGKPHFAPPWMRAVLIDPESGEEVGEGETGMIKIFDLANLGSVVAIQTQDLAVRKSEPDWRPEPDRRLQGFELLGRDPKALARGCSRSADEMLQKPKNGNAAGSIPGL